MKEGGPRIFSAISAAAGVMIYCGSYAGFTYLSALQYRLSTGTNDDEEVTSLLLAQLFGLSASFTGFPTVLSILAYTPLMWRRNQLFTGKNGRWVAIFGLLVCIPHLLSGGAFASSGMLSPSGVGIFIAAPMYYVWVLWVCALVYKDYYRNQGTQVGVQQTLLSDHQPSCDGLQ